VRVLYVIGAYPPASFYTGPPQQLHRLACELRAAAIDVRVVTSNANGPSTIDVPTARWIEFEGVPVYYGRRLPGTSDMSWDGWRTIIRESANADLIHVTGIFSWMNLAVATASRRRRVPVVVSPRGSLDPEALLFSARKKGWFLRAGGRRALEEAAAFHVTSEMERAYVEARLPGARIGMVPNGVVAPSSEDLARWTSAPAIAPTALFLGRIHPKKNVIPLVRAWSSIAPRHPDAKLVLAGPDDHGHRAEVERTIAGERLESSVLLTGRVVGNDKNELLARAHCLVLPSLTENFGNVVAEALAHRVPVIASTGTPWGGLRDHDCGWWVEPSTEGLARAIDEALTLDVETRNAMGERGRRWMVGEFSWPQVARRMADFYFDVLSRGGGTTA
jgi:glycosyltransferase involved in cell wall biosynthesis